MYTTISLILSLLAAASAADVAVSCKEGQPAAFDKVQVYIGENECTTSPCDLVRGQTARCVITFTTRNEVEVLEQHINATVLGTNITTPFPVPNAKLGCDKLLDGSYCPLDGGETARIQLDFQVLAIYPQVSLELLVYLLQQNGEEVACFKMRGNVVNP